MIIIEPACQQNSCIIFIVFNNEVSTLTATVKSFACWIFFFISFDFTDILSILGLFLIYNAKILNFCTEF